MNNAWFYEEGGQARGGVSLEELASHLSEQGEWRETLVWKAGFPGWKRAAEVDEVCRLLTRPPPLPLRNTQTASQPMSGQSASNAPSTAPSPSLRPKKTSWVLKALGWVGLFIVVALARGIGGEFGKALVTTDQAQELETGLSKTEAIARAELPKKLDEVTTLVAVDHEGTRLRFHYVVEGNISADAISKVRATLIPSMCAKRGTNGLNAGITFEYIYADKQSKALGTYTIRKSDCTNAS